MAPASHTRLLPLALVASSLPGICAANEISPSRDYFSLSLEELANIKVVTSSRRETTVDRSYANITVITKEVIARRGYRNVIEILEDLPGFDFATYEDGGGEYPTHMLNRGLGGDNGNTRLLVMVDGAVQNHISFNWSQGLTDEQMLFDVERIEVVQGPGSSLYGAQAVSGIIHIITKEKAMGTQVKALIGENNTQSFELLHGSKVSDINYQVALKSYQTDGDSGLGRPDPGGYFSGNIQPDFLTSQYDSNGQFLTNSPNPLAGQPIPNGFNTSKKDSALRLRMSSKDMLLGLNYWDKKDGLGSYTVGYEYNATADDYLYHHSGLTLYMRNANHLLEDKLTWKTDLWYRIDTQESDTGFRYIYRFNNLKKSYHSGSSQVGFENQFDWVLSDDTSLTFGTRLLGNRQTEQVVSLGQIQSGNASTTNASWDIAVAGNGLNQEKINEVFDESEVALYALMEGDINPEWGYSVGTRYNNGSDYGSTNTPRAGLIYRPAETWVIKALYGAAFRQPSLFELRDEFRGSLELIPEEVRTYEFELNKSFDGLGNIKVNVFYSSLKNSISLVEDNSRAGGERYANIDSSQSRGVSTSLNIQASSVLSFYANHIYQQGKAGNTDWHTLAHTARNKLNAGMNWQLFDKTLNLNLRFNHVGERKAPPTNLYFQDKVKGYQKVDFVVTWTGFLDVSDLSAQLSINNLLDEQFYGVGRQSGSSLRTEYDPQSQPDPPGFIPPYHPQPGRTTYLSFTYKL